MSEQTEKTKPDKIPQHWGTSSASFYADCEGEKIVVNLLTGALLNGELLGVGRFDLVLKSDAGTRVLVPKHAIASVILAK